MADRFEVSGQPLVPICLVSGGKCSNGVTLQPGEQLPDWTEGWHYFRLLTDRAFVRYFWQGLRWIAQAKDGSTAEFGLPLDNERDDSGMDRDLSIKDPGTHESPVFRWKLVRQYGPTGRRNVIVYQWERFTGANGEPTDGLSYLTNIYDTAMVSDASLPPGEIPRGKFAHHTRLAYVRDATGPSGVTLPTWALIWRRRPGWRLDHVDVTSAPFKVQEGGRRRMVRRYALDYASDQVHYFQARTMLGKVRVFPACNAEEGDDFRLPDTIGCGGEQILAEVSYTAGSNSFDIGKRVMEWWEFGGGVTFADVDGDAIADAIATPSTAGSPQRVTFTDILSGKGRQKEMIVSAPALGADTNTLLAGYKHQWVLGDWSANGRINALWFFYHADVGNPDNGLYTVYTGNDAAVWQWQGGTTLGRIPTQIGQENFYKRPPRVSDLNGDGLTDAFLITGAVDDSDPEHPKTVYWTRAFLSTRDAKGNITPFALTADGAKDFAPGSETTVAESVTDISGDGVPDLVRFIKLDEQDNFRWYVWYGYGDGRFVTNPSAFGPIVQRRGYHEHPEHWKFYLHDCNADGLADEVTLSSDPEGGNGIAVVFNDGSQFYSGVTFPGDGGPFTDFGRLEFVDFTGSGVDGILYMDDHVRGSGAFYYFKGMDSERPGLLKTITNGIGARTEFSYSTTTRLKKTSGWIADVPDLTYVVTGTQTTTNAGLDAGDTRGVSYGYEDPRFDPVQRRLRGFAQVKTTVANSVAADLVTNTRYFVGDCSDTAGPAFPCVKTVDNFWEVLHGLPVESDQTTNQGTYLSTSHQQYRVAKLYDGLDGRRVRSVYAQRADTWLYDSSNFTAQPEDFKIQEVVSDELNFSEHTVKLPAGHGTAMAHRISTMERDGLGNVTSTTDYGTADGGPGIEKDTRVTRVSTPIVLPGFNHSNWTWRTSDVYTRDETAATIRHRHAEYDSFGQLRKSFSDLSGTLPLLRSHQVSGVAVAPTPSDASQDGIAILLSETDYDAYGNPTRTSEARGSRCADLVYDDAFAQLVVSEAIYTHGCGGSALRTTRAYDRGLEVVTMSIDGAGAVSTTTYDGFARPTEQYLPDPDLGVIPESAPSVKITYTDVPNGPYQRVRAEVRDDEGSSPRYRSTFSYVNPYGQIAAVLQEADPAAGDAGVYIVSGETRRDKVGAVLTQYEPRFIAAFNPSASLPPPQDVTALHRDVSHDSFGRVVSNTDLDGALSSKVAYHALSEDIFDRLDLADGATPHPTTSVHDGFGRPVVTRQTTRQSGTPDTVQTRLTYTPAGDLVRVTRSHSASGDSYARNMQYDSWGRLVQNEEPNTSTGFGTPNVKAWRYAYNDAGNIVATSDARGCGKNSLWDGAGRLVEETYSPCMHGHEAYEEGRPTTRFLYDEPEPEQTPGRPNARLWAGKLAASYDRGAHMQYFYDGRGRTTAVRKQIAIPNEDDDPITEYAPHWFRREVSFDAANREIASTTGLDVADLQGESVTVGAVSGRDVVTTSYSARGIPNHVGGSYQDLVTRFVADADGAMRVFQYGDAAHTEFTTDYNVKRLPEKVTVRRSPPPIWSAPPAGYTPPPPKTTGQTLLADLRFSYDAVDNPLAMGDARIADEWPAGAMPVSRAMQYDDLYQLRRVDYAYATGDDTQVSPYAAEAQARDSRPIPEGALSNRARWQAFDFDWKGNVVKSDDDAHAFFDRSMGTMVHGSTDNGPNRVASAVAEKGHAHASYDASGNLTRLVLTKPGPDDDAIDIDFTYEWDEVGHLVHVKRAAISIPGRLDLGLDVRYAYDASDQRVLKSVRNPRNLELRHTVEVFPTLRLNDARFDENNDAEYERTAQTETGYLISNGSALARVAYEDASLPSADGKRLHVYFTVADPMGSTSIVFDKASSELVERATYLAFGQPESDYRPERWQSHREDYRFTGKEDDTGTGLSYFGYRYYVPSLGQWASADPLSIHQLESDMNPYAFAFGSPQRYVDPTGLASCDGSSCLPDMSAGWGSFVDASERGSEGGPPTGGGSSFWFESSQTGLPGGNGIPIFIVQGTYTKRGVIQVAENMLTVHAHSKRRAPPPSKFWVALELAKLELCGPLSSCGRGVYYVKNRYQDWFSSRQAVGDYFDKMADKTLATAIQGAGTVLGGGPASGQVVADMGAAAMERVGEKWLAAVVPALLQAAANAPKQPAKSPQPSKSVKPHRHHVFPKEMRGWFRSKGINIDDYEVKLPSNFHLEQLHGQKIDTNVGAMAFKPGGIWNENWRQWINANPNATTQQVLDQGRFMCKGFGLLGLAGCP